MKKYLIVFVFCFQIIGLSSIKAQQNLMSNASGYLGSFTLEKGRQPGQDRYHGVENSPYLNDEFKVGILKLRGGKVFEDQKFKYNIYENKIEYILEDKTYELSVGLEEFGWDKTNVGYTTLFRSESSLTKNGNPLVYYQIIADGEVKLLKQIKTAIKVVPDPIALGIDKKEFTNTESYFILNNDAITKVKKDKKSIVEALGGESPAVKNAIDALKTKFNSWESITELIQALATK